MIRTAAAITVSQTGDRRGLGWDGVIGSWGDCVMWDQLCYIIRDDRITWDRPCYIIRDDRITWDRPCYVIRDDRIIWDRPRYIIRDDHITWDRPCYVIWDDCIIWYCDFCTIRIFDVKVYLHLHQFRLSCDHDFITDFEPLWLDIVHNARPVFWCWKGREAWKYPWVLSGKDIKTLLLTLPPPRSLKRSKQIDLCLCLP